MSLEIPRTPEELTNVLNRSHPPRQQMFYRPPLSLPDSIQYSILSITNDKSITGDIPKPDPHLKKQEGTPRTAREVVQKLGWLSENDTKPKPIQTFSSENAASPQLRIEPTNSPSSLLNLCDPDQPTSVSLQIPEIPRTEEVIYIIANKVRMIQKIEGKSKAKLMPNKEDTNVSVIDQTDDPLSNLVNTGYISGEEAQQIRLKVNKTKVLRPTPQKRSRSADSSKTSQRKHGNQFKRNH
ncbi:3'-5' exonuclease family protein [Histomonas meleagridis]|uniref:3'-5' exonuclease family protein n=1 Tax=Histomonas meleagridis TaxID=135588 RepID=UPI003559B376|nr:3'-5' exonuclease family protein [Histomonas meleagridis]KAH0802855.1 3'-5' exonuclease family protein [Histomonas meleagridis]